MENKRQPPTEPDSKNLNEAREPLPSYFESLNTTKSTPLRRKEDLRQLITSEGPVKTLTEGHRAFLHIDKSTAEKLKRRLPAISPSVQFRGVGKTIKDFYKEPLWLMLDYDDLSEQELARLKPKALNIPYTMVYYRTVSGKGCRILLRYERPEECELTVTELHLIAIEKAMSIYDHLLGKESDKQCKDIVRCCGIAYDPEAYFNWEADVMPILPEEIESFLASQAEQKVRALAKNIKKAADSQPSKTADATCGSPSDSHSDSHRRSNEKKAAAPPTSQEVIEKVKEMAQRWQEQFEPHHHHNHVLRFATFCRNYGATEEDVVEWMNREFGSQYADTERTARWVYGHGEKGTWTMNGKHNKKATLKNIMQWLGTRYELHHNTISNQYQIRSISLDNNNRYLKWTDIDTAVRNSLYISMQIDGIYTSTKNLDIVIRSSFSSDYNPMKEYLSSLPTWDGETDYITELANTVTLKHTTGYRHTPRDFAYAFKKWLVNMVVGWLCQDETNQAIMVFVGKGGIFKTTFFDHLLPPSLRKYFANDSTGDYKSKDFLQMCSSKALVCLDELTIVQGKNQSSFKSNITKRSISMRIPYAEWDCLLQNNAGFCATSNELHIIPDSENRRYLMWYIDRIQSPIDYPFNYEGIYSQALALAREVKARKKAKEESPEQEGELKGWVYWFTAEDNEAIQRHNEYFRINNYIVERIKKFYKVPGRDTAPEYTKFVTASDVIERICTNPIFRQTMSNKDISKVMDELGFTKVHRHFGTCWIVIELRNDQIENNSKMDGTENLPPDEMPF